MAVKDPVVKLLDGRWHMWLCCHPLDLPDDTDRMSTHYATSDDGLDWDHARCGPDGHARASWDQRGARVADVVRVGGRWLAYYDGRATKEENAEERTGMAVGKRPGAARWPRTVPSGMARRARAPCATCRSSTLPDGGIRLFYETRRLDGAHDLRTEYVPPSR